MSRGNCPLSVAVILAALSIGQVSGQGIQSCTWDEASCGCVTEQGLINLKPLESGINSGPATTGDYFWNPCHDFTKDGLTAACMQYFSADLNYDCGVHSSMATSVENSYAVFEMLAGDNLRTSLVTCVCKSGNKLSFTSEEPTQVYNLKLESDYCCPGYTGGGSGGLSAGSVMVILFFVLLFVYVVGGVLFMTYLRKAEGKERIPNLVFWTALPALIKDGFRFTISCGKSSGYGQI